MIEKTSMATTLGAARSAPTAESNCDGAHAVARTAPMEFGARHLYHSLLAANATLEPGSELQSRASAFVRRLIGMVHHAPTTLPATLPASADTLHDWIDANVADVGSQYQAYLARRKSGAPREYFGSRSHALSFLRAVAPTKLVDGAWLYGLLPQWDDPRFAELVLTYIEELGDGDPGRNHVLLYRRLLQSHGIGDWAEQHDSSFVQGALQLALASCAEEFLPEIIGFNLGYEQLPLHLLITAYELDELGLDPTYFSLHVTVDNAASGHARRALRAVADAMPATGEVNDFWRRVGHGFRLGDIGFGTVEAIEGFDLHAELLRVLQSKTREGKVAHSDYCKLEGRSINDWLAAPGGVAGFVQALERRGWLCANTDPQSSRFWQLLEGGEAKMFGVFTDYELQVVYDWIRGKSASDGASFRSARQEGGPQAPRPFRHQRRATPMPGWEAEGSTRFDSGHDLSAAHGNETCALTLRLMGPAFHWTPAGLSATRGFTAASIRAA